MVLFQYGHLAVQPCYLSVYELGATMFLPTRSPGLLKVFHAVYLAAECGPLCLSPTGTPAAQ